MANYLVTLTYNATDVGCPEEAAEEFKLWFESTKHPCVNVREVPLDDDQDFTEVEL
jgi:hypothetical protein